MKHILRTLAVWSLFLLQTYAASAQYITHIAGNLGVEHTGDTSYAKFAGLRCPAAICIDDDGNIYIGDGGPFGYKGDACIRKIDAATGIITTIAGVIDSAENDYNIQDSIPAVQAKLKGVTGLCIDRNGNLLIADGHSTIRKIDAAGRIFTIAGRMGVQGNIGDNDTAWQATLNEPWDVAVDAGNNVYIADRGNNVVRRMGAVNPIITKVAGRYAQGFSGDGGAAVNAKMNKPTGIYLDGSNNLYICDYDNNRVRMVSASGGLISTIAGNGPGFSGDGGLAVDAKLNQPVRVTMDKAGNMYISDLANQRVRKIESGTGIITTYAGNGTYFSGSDNIGDKGPATAAAVIPYGLCVDKCSNLFMGGVVNSIRAITPVMHKGWTLCGMLVGTPTVTAAELTELQVFPNPNSGTFTLRLQSAANEAITIALTDITGRTVMNMAGVTNKDVAITLNAPAGMYFVNVATADGNRITRKIIVQ